MKVEFDLEKPIYDYMRHRKLDIEKIINETLRHKYHLGRDVTKPQPYLPIEKSVELALDMLKTDLNDPQSLVELCNYIIRLYPFTNEGRVMSIVGTIIKRKHKYDRFVQ